MGRAAIQRDLDKMEKWADRNLLKFIKEKIKVLPVGRHIPRHAGAAQLESSFVEKDLEVPVNTKLNMSQQYALATRKATSILA